jgi:glycosyltransferase involved in cell wall biosynthesis
MNRNIDPKSILVIIPTLNEEWGLAPTIMEINNYLQKSSILVVDGRSTDSTIKVATSLGAEVIFQKGSGKGDAIATALEKCREKELEYLVLIDADFTYPAVYFDRMLELLLKNPQIGMVCGNRFKAKVQFGDIFNKFQVGNKILSYFHTLLNGVNLEDPLTGLRIVRWSIVKDWKPKSKGFDIEVELNHFVKKSGFDTVEIPIDYRSRIGKKKLGIRHGLTILKRMILQI